MSQDPLALLRDIHAPPEPGWWPPAPIFALLAAIVLLALAVWAWRRIYTRRKPTLVRRVLRELAVVQKEYAQHADAQRLARELSGLLRRTALARHGNRVAGVSGGAWAEYLVRVSPADCDPALWNYLAIGRFSPHTPAPDPAVLLSQCRRWLRQAST